MSYDNSRKARLKRAGIAVYVVLCVAAILGAVCVPIVTIQWLADNGYTWQAWGVGIVCILNVAAAAGYFLDWDD